MLDSLLTLATTFRTVFKIRICNLIGCQEVCFLTIITGLFIGKAVARTLIKRGGGCILIYSGCDVMKLYVFDRQEFH